MTVMRSGTGIRFKHTAAAFIESFLRMGADLKLVLAFTLLALVFLFLPYLKETALRAVFGLLMVLFLPGYSLLAALLPRRSEMSLAERLIMSLCTGAILVPLIAIGLNFTPWGITLETLAACIALFIMACILIAYKRRKDLPAEERPVPDFRRLIAGLMTEIFPDRNRYSTLFLSILLILVMLGSFFGAAYVFAFPIQKERFTELYVLGPDDKAGNYTTAYGPDKQAPVIVYIANHELKDMKYRLLITLNDSGALRTIYSELVDLPDNQTYRKALNLTADNVGNAMKMEFQLYVDDASAPYRECYLWVDVTDQAGAT